MLYNVNYLWVFKWINSKLVDIRSFLFLKKEYDGLTFTRVRLFTLSTFLLFLFICYFLLRLKLFILLVYIKVFDIIFFSRSKLHKFKLHFFFKLLWFVKSISVPSFLWFKKNFKLFPLFWVGLKLNLIHLYILFFAFMLYINENLVYVYAKCLYNVIINRVSILSCAFYHFCYFNNLC